MFCRSPVVVGLLVLKGHYWPSCVDSGSSGSLIMDVYWGVELYPRLLWVSEDPLGTRAHRSARSSLLCTGSFPATLGAGVPVPRGAARAPRWPL